MPKEAKLSIVARPNRSPPTLATINTSRAAEPRRHGLIRPLAAEAHFKVLAEQGLAGAREDIRECREVGVGAADDGDAGCA